MVAQDMKAIHDSEHTLVMGVLNITEDSFSDGGLWLDPAKAKAHGEAMMKDGADIIDIGAESTRPGAKRVSEEDEKSRVLGAVDALVPEGAILSIDTTRAWMPNCPTWWPTTPKACTSYSIGAVGWPERPAMCLTPTPPCMRTGC